MEKSELELELEALRKENREMKERILRDFMERAIRDDQLSRDFESKIQQFYPLPVTPWYVCIAFWGDKPSQSVMPEFPPSISVGAAFSSELSNFGQPYFLESQETVVCILNADLDDAPEIAGQEFGLDFCNAIRDALTPIWEARHKDLQISHITISHVETMAQGPRFLYRSAVSVSERRTGDSPPVCVEQGRRISSRQDYSESLALELRFWSQIERQAFFDAATTLDNLIELTTLEEGSLERTLAAVFSRMELVLRTISPHDQGSILHDPEIDNMLRSLGNAGSFWEMRQIAYDMLATMEDRFCTTPDARNRKLANIEQYLKEHYTDLSISATSIAERFKLSTSYLSRVFRADMNTGLVEYIHRLRVEKAKDLLSRTDLSMEEIALQSGFSNRWTLNRVFKDMEGVTPGRYRDHIRSNDF